jgi:hypothetical protein
MSRAARKPKTKIELEAMSLDQLNAELKYLRVREQGAGASSVGKLFAKEIAAVEAARLKQFGVVPRRR